MEKDFPTWLRELLGIPGEVSTVSYTEDEVTLEPLGALSAEMVASLDEPTELDARMLGYRRRLGLLRDFETTTVFTELSHMADAMKQADTDKEMVEALISAIYAILDDALKARSVLISSAYKIGRDENLDDDIVFALVHRSSSFVEAPDMAELNVAANIIKHDPWSNVGGDIDKTELLVKSIFDDE